MKFILITVILVLFSATSYSQFKSKEKDSEENPLNKLLNRNATTSNRGINTDAPDIFS